jgi:hypothetical protein
MTEQPEQPEQPEPRRLAGEAAWKAHLATIEKRNGDARKKAAERASSGRDVAHLARARRLKDT